MCQDLDAARFAKSVGVPMNMSRLMDLDGEKVFAVENVRKCFVCNNFLAESLVYENYNFPCVHSASRI
jgi:PP-loop superfamily ATP-utilizing enzyme